MLNLEQKLIDNLCKKQQVVFDPMTAILIAKLAIDLIKMIQKCREKPQDAVTLVHFPSEREQKVVKRKLRRELGFFKYLKEGEAYYQAVLATGRETTGQDLEDAYDSLGRGQ